ncbi:MAG: hypothetical protein ABIJ09_14275 [Pseudomonadota bacterium]
MAVRRADRGRTAGAIAVSLSALASVLACPASTVPASELAFACQRPQDCVAGQRCVNYSCVAIVDGGAGDAWSADRKLDGAVLADTSWPDGQVSDSGDASPGDGTAPDQARQDTTAPRDGSVPDIRVDASNLDQGRPDDAGGQDQGRSDGASEDAAMGDSQGFEAGGADATAHDAGLPSVTGVPVDLGTTLGQTTTFSFVFSFVDEQDRAVLILGPRADGSGAIRMQPDGSDVQAMQFAFTRDVTGTRHSSNTCSSLPECQPYYPSIGFLGCQSSTVACGPDNENSRALFAGGYVKAAHWLLVTGGKASNLDYVYMTPDRSVTPTFRHVDLSAAPLGGNTKGLSAMHVFNDRVYLGFPDTGGNQPYLLELRAVPDRDGLEAVADVDVVNLGGTSLPEVGGEQNLDQIWDLHGKLYLANNGGCRFTATSTPEVCSGNCSASWPSCTPSASAYTDKTSFATSKVSELLPRDRAWVGPAILDGRLYLGRNTSEGPQLWFCDPSLGGAPLDCEPGDWRLIAANSVGDVELSQFDNPRSDRISLVAAVDGVLFVGLDNPVDGIVLFRATQALPVERHHFEGLDGCGAHLHPDSCQGMGGNGFGSPSTTTRILDSTAVEGGGGALVIVVGNELAVPRVLRVR